ncbi:growth hormone secretagogue receptor type 1-like [Microcaecilia unicolor]|uniref:Growth hormone secretagogue receptor type 1 n=1 Tax=Microcaecilia unicolor TaxID=1415580 RepID=A0A6P7YTJ1_9AMPH|nr:growth hormone secretagogue receptor type 1-like [Microcaecilia unicolor]
MGSFLNYSQTGNYTDYEEDFLFTNTSLFDLQVLIPVTIICIILFILGITGNFITILIFKRHKEMRTTVNMYLSSMALSDIFIFLGLPADLYRIWKYKPYIFGDFLCKFFCYMSETYTYCTILHITTLSVERYLAVCFPLRARIIITKGRVKGVIILLWLFALITAIPTLFLFGVEHRAGSSPEETMECKFMEHSAHTGLLKIMICVSTIYFFLPMFCLALLYGLICRKLWMTRSGMRKTTTLAREKYHKPTIKMLAVVVMAFVFCWLPFHIGRILFAWTGIGQHTLYQVSQYLNLVSMLLFYLSASINPILYNIMSQKYRSAMSKILYHSQALKSRNVTRSEPNSTEGTDVISSM